MVRSLLLHSCCGPCSTYTVKRLREGGLEVACFWYNPNIHPFLEHRRRLEAMQAFCQKSDLPFAIADGYEVIEYFRRTVGHEGDRCLDCYRLRLARAASFAREKGFSAFSTTLLVSPYQNHDLLRQVGEEVGREERMEFYYEDLRPGFRESQRLARELGLYRQPYCGCLYSEWERYAKVKTGEGFRWA